MHLKNENLWIQSYMYAQIFHDINMYIDDGLFGK